MKIEQTTTSTTWFLSREREEQRQRDIIQKNLTPAASVKTCLWNIHLRSFHVPHEGRYRIKSCI